MTSHVDRTGQAMRELPANHRTACEARNQRGRRIRLVVSLLICGVVTAVLVWDWMDYSTVSRLARSGAVTSADVRLNVKEDVQPEAGGFRFRLAHRVRYIYEYRVGSDTFQGEAGEWLSNEPTFTATGGAPLWKVDVTFLPSDPSVHRVGHVAAPDIWSHFAWTWFPSIAFGVSGLLILALRGRHST
jgi:hypothetical protein